MSIFSLLWKSNYLYLTLKHVFLRTELLSEILAEKLISDFIYNLRFYFSVRWQAVGKDPLPGRVRQRLRLGGQVWGEGGGGRDGRHQHRKHEAPPTVLHQRDGVRTQRKAEDDRSQGEELNFKAINSWSMQEAPDTIKQWWRRIGWLLGYHKFQFCVGRDTNPLPLVSIASLSLSPILLFHFALKKNIYYKRKNTDNF